MKKITMVRYMPQTSSSAITESLITCYQQVFAGGPWYEKWTYDQIKSDIFHEITQETSCWIALANQCVVGFCWGYRIPGKDLEKKLDLTIPSLPQSVGYHDELGVHPTSRERGIARELFKCRLNDFLNQGLSYGAVRTRLTPEPSPIYSWYQKLGYEIIARYPDPDGRIIMGCELEKLRRLL